MSQNKSGQEKTEQATSKRKQDALEKGQVARSRDLNTAIILIFGSGGMLLIGQKIVQTLTQVANHAWSFKADVLIDDHYIVKTFLDLCGNAIVTLLPLFAILVFAALLGPVLLSGFSINFKTLIPKMERLDPIKGLKKVFGVRGLMELVKALAKFLLVSSLAIVLLWYQFDSFLSLANKSLLTAMQSALSILGWSFLALSSILIIIASIDVPFQLWQHFQQLKMTKQEVKDEMKDIEGKPEVKAKIRRVHQEMSQKRMMEAVPKADVIVTNQTHFSAALQYDQEKQGAPKVIAKGRGLIATNIKAIAKENNIPLVEAPPLARAIYFTTKLNHEIPAGLYVAVARVLAYVDQLKRYEKGKGTRPSQVGDLPIPDDLKA